MFKTNVERDTGSFYISTCFLQQHAIVVFRLKTWVATKTKTKQNNHKTDNHNGESPNTK